MSPNQEQEWKEDAEEDEDHVAISEEMRPQDQGREHKRDQSQEYHFAESFRARNGVRSFCRAAATAIAAIACSSGDQRINSARQGRVSKSPAGQVLKRESFSGSSTQLL